MSSSDRRARLLLRLLLTVMGLWLVICSRLSGRFRSQLTRSVVIELGSDDGVASRFVFDGATRRVALHGDKRAVADCALRFSSAELALSVMGSKEASRLMREGLGDGTIRFEGSPALFGWFQGLLGAALPARNVRKPLPQPYVEPNRSAAHAGWITVEAAVSALDSTWTGAARAREQLVIWRVANGERSPRG